MKNIISIKGAREHNLKNINIDIPKNTITVITGVSGSGKSSLAFDTIYAEGQRRYVESLSSYARQFLDSFNKPDVDSIEGLSPAISIEQKTTSKNPRSTVGTITEIYDYLRILFARVGTPYSPATGLPIEKQTVSQMVDKIISLKEGTRVHLLATIARNKKGEYKKEFDEFRKKGFERVKINGQDYTLDDLPTLDKNQKHNISIIVSRIKVKQGIEQNLADSFATILKISHGVAIAELTETNEEIIFSENFACPVSGFTIEELEPRIFSFNNPIGACNTCNGLGNEIVFDLNLIIPNHKEAIIDCVAPWKGPTSFYYKSLIDSFCNHYKINSKTPYNKIPPDIIEKFLYGTEEKILIEFESQNSKHRAHKPFEGVIPHFERRIKETTSSSVQEGLSSYQSSKVCSSCNGKRLNQKALQVKINQKDIFDICNMSITKSLQFFQNLPKSLNKNQLTISDRLLKEITERLYFLNNVGIGYLNLNRSSGTLSGGESQRIRLASQIGSGLTGVLYVLDEPSIGLHQKDNDKLLETLTHLKNLGNTVIVVEHDEDAIKMADFLIDIGPRAGIHGGHIIAKGTPQEVAANKNSITGQYLSGIKKIEVPKKRRQGNGKYITIEGASGNNLKNLTAKFPLGKFVAVTGVSGSGKSTLVNETLYKAISNSLHNSLHEVSPYKKITGIEYIDKVIDIDQSPIGRQPSSNPATYSKVFDLIRNIYAELPDSKARGYTAGRFSFNVKGGRCEACQGDGLIKIEMNFLPDVYVKCEVCNGTRYNRETLEVKWKNKSISDVLKMTIEEAYTFFENIPNIFDKIKALKEVGLDYMELGQSSTTLSGGEAQRVKLAKELSKRSTGKTLYILDEPTTGLHFEDINKLLEVLHKLVDIGNTVVVIEHNLDVIKTADYIIDIGKEGGDLGGQLVCEGTPEEVIKNTESYTAKYLKRYLP